MTRSVPGRRRLQHVLGSGDRDAAGSDFERLLAGVALQQGVVLALQAGGADAVDVGAPDDAAAGVPAGHDPPVLVVDGDAGEAERADLPADPRIGLPGDVEEAAVARRHVGRAAPPARSSDRSSEVAEGVDRPGRVEHLARVDGDRRSGHGQGQLVAVAVEDRAALGRQLTAAGPQLGGLGSQRLAAGALHQTDLGEHAAEDENEHDERPDQAGPGPAGAEAVDEQRLASS